MRAILLSVLLAGCADAYDATWLVTSTYKDDTCNPDSDEIGRETQMYVNTFDRQIKTDDEHSTIGIILCKQKNKALVEITLPQDANIHAREYQLYLPAKEELQRKLLEWAAEAEARHA